MEIKRFKVSGLRELEDFMLKELPAATNRRIVLSGMRKAAKPAQSAAVAKAPHKSGSLEMSLGFASISKNKSVKEGHFASVLLGSLIKGRKAVAAWVQHMNFYKKNVADSKHVGRIRHGHLVEFGYMRRTKGGGTRTHVPAKPYLRPAFDSTAHVFLSRFTEIMRKKITVAVKRKYRGKRR